MADPTRTEDVLGDASDLAAAARDRGMEQLEGAKGQLAEGAERVAAAVERTADELEGDGDDTISGFGRSLAGLMRQLAGGLRERDIEQFAGELGALARRNPGVFLAGSVALGFGVARFFKARSPQRGARSDYGEADGHDRHYAYGANSRYDTDSRMAGGSGGIADRGEFDADESLDLSANPSGIDRRETDERVATSESTLSSATGSWTEGASSEASASSDANDSSMSNAGQQSAAERGQMKSRPGKSKAKSQRSATDAGGKES